LDSPTSTSERHKKRPMKKSYGSQNAKILQVRTRSRCSSRCRSKWLKHKQAWLQPNQEADGGWIFNTKAQGIGLTYLTCLKKNQFTYNWTELKRLVTYRKSSIWSNDRLIHQPSWKIFRGWSKKKSRFPRRHVNLHLKTTEKLKTLEITNKVDEITCRIKVPWGLWSKTWKIKRTWAYEK